MKDTPSSSKAPDALVAQLEKGLIRIQRAAAERRHRVALQAKPAPVASSRPAAA